MFGCTEVCFFYILWYLIVYDMFYAAAHMPNVKVIKKI